MIQFSCDFSLLILECQKSTFSLFIFLTFYLHFIFQILPQSSFTKCHSNEIEQLPRTAKARQSISPFESAVSGWLENKEPQSKKEVFFEP